MSHHDVTIAAMSGLLLASYLLLAVLARHPRVLTQTGRDIADLAGLALTGPGRYARGLAYHHAHARHTRPHTTTPASALTVRTS